MCFLGSPVIAVGIGLLIALYGLFGHLRRSQALERMEEGVQSAGIILLVTGAGGAPGNVLRESGAGEEIAKLIAKAPLPAVLLPFFISTGTTDSGEWNCRHDHGSFHLGTHDRHSGCKYGVGRTGSSHGFHDVLLFQRQHVLGGQPDDGDPKCERTALDWSVPTTLAWAVSLVLLLLANLIVG